MGESSTGDANFVKDDLLDWSEEHTLIESFLEEAPFKELCGDGIVVGVTPSIAHIGPICTKSLDLIPISSPFLPTTLFQFHALHKSLGDIRGYNPSLDLYYVYLGDMPRKIMKSTYLIILLIFPWYLISVRGH